MGAGGGEDDTELFKRIDELYSSVEATSSPLTVEDDIEALKHAVSSPTSKRGRVLWSCEHDKLISDALRRHGPRWRLIARELNIGSDDCIRNRVARFQVDALPPDVRRIVEKLHGNREKRRRRRGDRGEREEIKHVPWEPMEDAYIERELENGRRGAWVRLSEGGLAHRSKHAIRNRAARLGLI